jgi:FixJ family two-component response regulator
MDDMNFLHQSFDGAKLINFPPIIIVEDDKLLGLSLKKYLEQTLKLDVQLFTSSEDLLMNFARIHPKDAPFCLVTDISLEQGSDGLLLIDILKDKGFEFVSIVMTGFASIETAIAATKKGVFHYLTKPFELENLKKLIIQALQAHNVARWQFHPELAVSSLRALDVPIDMHDSWNRMVDELDEMEMDDDDLTGVLARLRPDAWAISWGKRQVLLLELTRAHDWRQDWASTTDTFKVQRYARLQTRMQALLPWGWVVETVPLTIGVRGSIHEPTWRRILDRFGIETRDTQERFFHDLTRQTLEELDRMYGVRSEALRQLHAGPDARRS